MILILQIILDLRKTIINTFSLRYNCGHTHIFEVIVSNPAENIHKPGDFL